MSVNNVISLSPNEYDEIAVIAKEAGEEMLTRLSWIKIQPKTILNLQCKTGFLSENLMKLYPDAMVMNIDSNLSMLDYAKQHKRINFAALANTPFFPIKNQAIDLIIANLVLPWEPDVKSLLLECKRILTPNGLFMLSLLGPSTLQELPKEIKAYKNFSGLDMHDLGDELQRAGFVEPILDVNYCTLQYKNEQQLINELMKTDILMSLPTSTQLEKIHQVTFEMIQAHAFAALSTFKNETASIPLSLLRQQLANYQK